MGIPEPFCPICGQSMPFRDLRQHELAQHPDIYQPGHTAALEGNRRYRKLVAPLIALWAVGSLAGLFTGAFTGAEAFVVLVLLPPIIMIVGFAYARTPIRRFQQQAKTIHVPCSICGVVVPSGDLKAHMYAEHRSVARYVIFVRDFVMGAFLLFFFGIVPLVLLYQFHVLSEAEVYAIMFSATAFLVGVTVWFRTLALRHLLRLRNEWKESHPVP